MKKPYNDQGVDWLEVVIPPQNVEEEAEYTIRAHLTFLLSNWECIFGRGCAGLFGVQDSVYNDDAGCCTDSFWFSDKDDYEHTAKMIKQLTPDDWDDELRAHVEKNGWANIYDSDDDTFNGKGKVYKGACVFQNRNGGSTGHPGCAFHYLGKRTNQSHVDLMPTVCWQLPLRFTEVEDDIYTLTPWQSNDWNQSVNNFDDMRYHCAWWCTDSPEAYIGEGRVYRSLETELRKTLGDHAYDVLVAAIESRLASGNTYAPMPGAIVNGGRPLLPLIVGNRTPRNEPSNYPAILDKMKDNNNGTDSGTT